MRLGQRLSFRLFSGVAGWVDGVWLEDRRGFLGVELGVDLVVLLRFVVAVSVFVGEVGSAALRSSATGVSEPPVLSATFSSTPVSFSSCKAAAVPFRVLGGMVTVFDLSSGV